MESLSESLVAQLNYKLDDLNVPNTFRFSLPELLENVMTEPIAVTSRLLLQKLRFYDESVLPISGFPDFHQIWLAIQSRHPPFSSDDKFTLYHTLDFLCTNLQGERMLRLAQGAHRDVTANRGKIAFRLDKINREMNVNSQAAEEVTVVSDIISHISRVYANTPREVLLNPPKILSKYLSDMGGLTSSQIELLNRVNSALLQDFTLRRRMLIKRLDVTIRSFLWGERAAGKEEEIVGVINDQRKFLSERPAFYQIEDAIAAPISLLHEHSKKVTGGAGTAGSIVKKVLIGKVPDRGGRPLAEHRAKAIIAKEGRGFGRGGGGRDHGGRGRGHGGRGGGDHEKKRKEELGEQSSGSSKKGRTVTLT